MQETYLLISEAAQLLHVESHILRYWEEELELKIKRNEFGHRCYTQKDVHLLLQVKEWKEKGYPLKAIKSFLLNPSDNLIPMPGLAAPPVQSPAAAPTALAAPPREVTAPAACPAPSAPSAPPHGLTADQKMEQFQLILNRIVSSAIRENNDALGQEVGSRVSKQVLKEMDYLMRTQEEAMEAHFQNLDQAIRKQLSARPEKIKPEKEKKARKHKPSKKERAAQKEAAALKEVKAMQEAAAAKD